MKSEYLAILAICIISLTVPMSGCSGPSNPELNNSSNDITISPQVTPSVTQSPTMGDYTTSVEIPENKPSILFRTDNISWYEYIVTYKRDTETNHEKLVVDYQRYADINPEYGTSTSIQQISGYNGTMYQIVNSGNTIHGSILAGLKNGVRGYHSLALIGNDSLLGVRKLDISTRFDAITDRTMKPVSNETIMYKGELYDCVVYEVNIDNDTFMVWHNTSLPIPLKVVAHYENRACYVYPFNEGIATGPCTYDLVNLGTDRTNIPGWYEAPSEI